MFTRLGAIEKASGQDWMPSMLRTHPMSDKRVRAIETHLPEVRCRFALPSFPGLNLINSSCAPSADCVKTLELKAGTAANSER